MDELAKRFAELAAQYGPTIADAAKAAARTEAYSSLMSGVVCLIVGGVLIKVGYWIANQCKAQRCDSDWFIASVICWVIGGLITIPGIWSFVDPWVWTTLSRPELWIAKKAFGL